MSERNTFEWSNPIDYEAAGVTPLRDPFILRVGDVWYMTGSLPPYAAAGERPGERGAQRTKGVPLYKSTDLLHWSFVDHIVPAPADTGVWYNERFWAPELFAHNGRYYVTVNCTDGVKGTLGCLLAAAENIEGPYTVLTPDAPLAVGNDAHLYADENGEVWLFETGIWCAKVDLDTPRLLTEKRFVVQPVPESDAWNARRRGVGFEGPFVLRKDGVCRLFYSSWARGYEVGVAEAPSPEGEWRMLPEPVYGAQDPSWCRLWGAQYQSGYYAAEGVIGQAGHNCVFDGPDGGWWIAAHAYGVTEDPFANIFDVRLVLDKLELDAQQNIVCTDAAGRPVKGPTLHSRAEWNEDTLCANRAPLCVPDVRCYVRQGEVCTLPAQADILLNNGFRQFAAVQWEAFSQPAVCGEYAVHGCARYGEKEYPVTAHITVYISEASAVMD